MKNYPLRNIPDDLWKKAWQRKIDEGTDIRQLLIEGLRLRLEQPVRKTERR